MDRTEIRNHLSRSSLRGLVPANFEIHGHEIEFKPSQAFWQRWRREKSWLSGRGVSVYATARYRKAKRGEWRVRVNMLLISHLIESE